MTGIVIYDDNNGYHCTDEECDENSNCINICDKCGADYYNAVLLWLMNTDHLKILSVERNLPKYKDQFSLCNDSFTLLHEKFSKNNHNKTILSCIYEQAILGHRYMLNDDPKKFTEKKTKKLNDTLIDFYDNGTTQCIYNFNGNNKKDGNCTIFYHNGAIMQDWNFSLGKPHGTCTYYFENGKIEMLTEYNMGVKISCTKFYDNENIKSHFDYNGKELKNCIGRVFHTNGVLKLTGLFVDGKKEGSHVLYFCTGAKFKSYLYNNGLFLYSCKFYKNGYFVSSKKAVCYKNKKLLFY